MDLAALKAELTSGHPDTGPYDADDSIAAGQLNAKNRTRNKESLTGSEVMNAIDQAAWDGLQDPGRQKVWNIVHMGTVNPFGREAALLIDVFGAGSATIVALALARVTSISRAVEVDLGVVRAGDIQRARA
jgi:hypothetical protein